MAARRVRWSWVAGLGAVCAALIALPSAAFAQAREPVRFAPGATVANVAGQLVGNQVREYLLRTQAPQAVELTVSGAPPETLFIRVIPSGRSPSAEIPLAVGANESSFRITLPAAGDYIIRIALRTPEDNRRTVTFALRVALMPRVDNTAYYVVDFVCADRTTLRVLTTQDRSAARIERLGQAWVLPRIEAPQGTVRFSDASASFVSRGEEGVLERRNLPTLRCRQAGR